MSPHPATPESVTPFLTGWCSPFFAWMSPGDFIHHSATHLVGSSSFRCQVALENDNLGTATLWLRGNTEGTVRFGTKCSGCLQGISPQDLVRKARDRVFHLKCFTCCVCRKQLSTGEELYVLDENKFICKHDYMSGKAMTEAFVGGPGGSDDEDEEPLDIKPQIDHHNTPTGAPVLPPPHHPLVSTTPTSNSNSPSSNSTSTGGVVGVHGAMIMSRPTTPSSGMGAPPSATTTPLTEPMSVGDSKVNIPLSSFNRSSVP
ncbi:uncharacterized protein LOC143032584 [Oratosquilla oratoria]|uniref:uncharacterized protein LOC143032584 n=1 Tax=Oratosquilla oratoria TaxID=337810 RepID=UPI003F760119